MSGFGGVFHLDGKPVDRTWLENMAESLAFRGPDRSQIWISANAGIVHTHLRTRAETDGQPQIKSLDGNTWVAGDVRIDDRETLFAKLNVPLEILRHACGTELVLHSYAAWGEACVEHLIGDFSFVIWDTARQSVFGARDQMGVKLLYYALVGECLIVSNTLESIRQIRIVSSELNEQAIGDFLISGSNRNPSSTYFSAILRLPVANKLCAKVNEVKTEKYWTLPIDKPLYYKRSADYVSHFHELLRSAVVDRLPAGPLGIFMSGGLDSPAVAATAVKAKADVTAFTSVYEKLIPDEEGYYAGLVAKHLGIPIQYNIRDDELWGWKPNTFVIRTPEPVQDPTSLHAMRSYNNKISTHTNVFFLGDGPDAALIYEWRSHFQWLAKQRKWGRLCRDLVSDFSRAPRVPWLHRLPRIWRERPLNQADWYCPTLPTWLHSEFAAKLKLGERWEELTKPTIPRHQIRRLAYDSFANDFPMGGVDFYDAGFTGTAIELLHPLWDLRLIRFLLAVPTMPWCRDKYLIRLALRGILPEAVRKRPKSPLAGHPYLLRARSADKPELPKSKLMDQYVNSDRLPKWPGHNREDLDFNLRVLGLHYWLVNL